MNKTAAAGADTDMTDFIGTRTAPEDQVAFFEVGNFVDFFPSIVGSIGARTGSTDREACFCHAVIGETGTIECIRAMRAPKVRIADLGFGAGDHARNAGSVAAFFLTRNSSNPRSGGRAGFRC